MAIQEQITDRLAEFLPVYQEIGKLLSEATALQLAEQAQADYQEQTARLDEEINQLEIKKNEIEASIRMRKLEAEGGARNFRPPINVNRPIANSSQSVSMPKERLRPATSNQEMVLRVRKQLTKLVGRWGPSWKLSRDIQGQINRIADDPAKPLGEALVMLEWATFEHRYGRSETDEDHLGRIIAWGAALVEYRERLSGEIDMLKTKYRRILPILAAWIGRDTEEGRKSWEQQISETNAAKREEVEKLRAEIASLTAEMEIMKRPHPAVD
jgi:hypothetical protein